MGHVENGSWFSDYSGEEIDSRLSLLKNVSRQTALIGDTENNKARGYNVENAAAIGTGLEVSGYGLAFGKYNVHIPTPGHLPPGGQGYFIEEVGNGTDEDNRSNARTLDWQGNERLAGKLTLGKLPTGAMDAVPRCLVTNPNLLDNAYFAGGGSGYGIFPVNQRGQTQYSGGNNYFDRWKGSTNISVTLQSDGVLVSSSGSSGVSFYQGLPIEPLLGKTVTSSILTADGTLYVGTGTMPSSVPASGNVYISSVDTDVGKFNLAYVSARSQLEFTITLPGAGRSIKLAAAKLEFGSIQTLAHQESGAWVPNEIPRYDDELRRCQAVYEAGIEWHCAADQYGNIRTTVPYKVTKAGTTVPTVESAEFWNGSGWSDCTSSVNVQGLDTYSEYGFIYTASGLNNGAIVRAKFSAIVQ